MRSSWQNDMSEEWVMHWALKLEVLGLILGSKKKGSFLPCLIVSDL